MTNGKGSHPSMNSWFPYGLHVIRCQTSQLSLNFGHHVIPTVVLILQSYHTLLQLMRSWCFSWVGRTYSRQGWAMDYTMRWRGCELLLPWQVWWSYCDDEYGRYQEVALLLDHRRPLELWDREVLSEGSSQRLMNQLLLQWVTLQQLPLVWWLQENLSNMAEVEGQNEVSLIMPLMLAQSVLVFELFYL